MAPNTCFESLSFGFCHLFLFQLRKDLLIMKMILILIFATMFLISIHNYPALDKFQRNFKPFSKQSLSILHLNIRSINKNFEAFKQSYLSLNFNFNVVCFPEIWANDININKNSSFQLPNCNNEL